VCEPTSSSNSSGSRPVWKLLLSKASPVLDGALDLLTNAVRTSTSPQVAPLSPDQDYICFTVVVVVVCFLVDSGPHKPFSANNFGSRAANPIGRPRPGRPQRPRFHPAVVPRTPPTLPARRHAGLPVVSRRSGVELRHLPGHVSATFHEPDLNLSLCQSAFDLATPRFLFPGCRS